MTGAAATAFAAVALDALAVVAAVILGIWLPVVAAVTCTVLLLLDEARRCWKRWHVIRTWARRLSN